MSRDFFFSGLSLEIIIWGFFLKFQNEKKKRLVIHPWNALENPPGIFQKLIQRFISKRIPSRHSYRKSSRDPSRNSSTDFSQNVSGICSEIMNRECFGFFNGFVKKNSGNSSEFSQII